VNMRRALVHCMNMAFFQLRLLSSIDHPSFADRSGVTFVVVGVRALCGRGGAALQAGPSGLREPRLRGVDLSNSMQVISSPAKGCHSQS
jgi:hypothetical protein